ncbi:MAG: hypothetical protein FJ009_16950 [Chloroflexi bacterium]|nr:hypothetical protein [Chloroflexota bacterium]
MFDRVIANSPLKAANAFSAVSGVGITASITFRSYASGLVITNLTLHPRSKCFLNSPVNPATFDAVRAIINIAIAPSVNCSSGIISLLRLSRGAKAPLINLSKERRTHHFNK